VAGGIASARLSVFSSSSSIMAAPGLGFKIMQALAGQLGGRLEVFDSDGLTVRVAFGA